jgi:hypothetical protein
MHRLPSIAIAAAATAADRRPRLELVAACHHTTGNTARGVGLEAVIRDPFISK